jgi:tRNA nucleotidyltransferase/poly(A) polymerase
MVRRQLEQFARDLRHVQPLHDGEALKGLGLQPGPRFGVIMKALRDAWLDGRVSDRAGEQALLDELLRSEHTE